MQMEKLKKNVGNFESHKFKSTNLFSPPPKNDIESKVTAPKKIPWMQPHAWQYGPQSDQAPKATPGDHTRPWQPKAAKNGHKLSDRDFLRTTLGHPRQLDFFAVFRCLRLTTPRWQTIVHGGWRSQRAWSCFGSGWCAAKRWVLDGRWVRAPATVINRNSPKWRVAGKIRSRMTIFSPFEYNTHRGIALSLHVVIFYSKRFNKFNIYNIMNFIT